MYTWTTGRYSQNLINSLHANTGWGHTDIKHQLTGEIAAMNISCFGWKKGVTIHAEKEIE
jgi:hypothetical protein